MTATFNKYAPRIMHDLMRDLRIGKMDAAAIVGNLAHECGGFEKMQELKPTVKGSRGGYGWAQWTGPRRRQFEKFASDLNLDPKSYEANYSFLVWELKNGYRGALKKMAAETSLAEKVKAFELAYEKAGVKHYASRTRWARQAVERYDMAIGAPEVARQPGASREAVKAAQERLRELGYYEVGKADGVVGTRTIGAITAFQAHENLKRTGELDAATLDRLKTADPRPVSREREELTVDDLRKEGSETIRRQDEVKRASWLQGLMGMLVAAFGAVVQFFGDAWDSVSELRYVFTSIPIWVWGGLAVAMSIYLWRKAEATQDRRLEDERSGKHAGAGD